mmetsp:Transcript_4301/g.5142  ORF Transcript_4301/g.5142 Transcript_4301/m.5142 type:complete len:193 (+) Transcript_4301:44-622(+)
MTSKTPTNNEKGSELTRSDDVVETSLTPAMETTSISHEPTPPPAAFWSPSPQSLPTTLTRSVEILGVATDCWVQLFGDRIMFGVSQLRGKVGTMISCQVEDSGIIDGTATRFTIEVLLGKRDDDMLGVYARRILDQLLQLRTSLQDACPPILLAISLQPQTQQDPEMFKGIVDTVVQMYQEAVRTASSSSAV